MERNKAIILLFILALIAATMLLIPAQAEENTSVPANNTLPANISQAVQEQITAGKVVETVFFIGIILSPLSFILAIVALWVAWKNRKKVYKIG